MRSEQLNKIIESMGGRLSKYTRSWIVWFDDHGYRCDNLREVAQLIEALNQIKNKYEYVLWNGDQWVVTM